MKAIAIAGSARKYGSGAQLLKKALEGAKDGGWYRNKINLFKRPEIQRLPRLSGVQTHRQPHLRSMRYAG